MYILGINPGHNATACLLKDGKIIACVSEERFSRLKNHVGFPHKSIKYLLDFAKIKSNQLDKIILTGVPYMNDEGKQYDCLYDIYKNKGLLKKIFGYFSYKYPSSTNSLIEIKHALARISFNKRIKLDKKILSKMFGISEEQIVFIEHHLSHELSAVFNIPKNKPTLLFSLDAEGTDDGLCATVSIFDPKNNSIKRLSQTKKRASLGQLYGITTLFLGMKPNQHEFKVMGLAPYAKKDKVEETYNKIREILWIEGLKFKSKFRMQYADSYFFDKMKFVRFDNVAGGVQKLAEELVLKWVYNAIKKTGIRSIALSGGVFMNVKANQRISEMPEVEEVFCVPSCGDESTAIGACMYGYRTYCEENNIQFKPEPIKDLYLGPEYSEEYVKALIKNKNLSKKYKITYLKNINKEIAKLLAKGEIVARCSGKSEWGARALGNRSILANPVHKDTVRILNETIKDRDFWMPFTPSIIDKDMTKYSLNPKKIEAPYMVITFDSTEKAREELPAAMHPYDFTIRPQAVYKLWNPDYYELIDEFRKLTGTGAVLNTSFNLHGEPNVLTPEDAFHTVENSSLKYLALGNYLFEKKE